MRRKWRFVILRCLFRNFTIDIIKVHNGFTNSKFIHHVYEAIIQFKSYKYLTLLVASHKILHLLLPIIFSISLMTSIAFWSFSVFCVFVCYVFSISWLLFHRLFHQLFHVFSSFVFIIFFFFWFFCSLFGIKSFKLKENIKN